MGRDRRHPLETASREFAHRWLERFDNRKEWERLRSALALATGFQFFVLQAGDPSAEAVLEDLLREETEDLGLEVAGSDLSYPGSDLPLIRVVLEELRSAFRPCLFYFHSGMRLHGDAFRLRELFTYLNQKREVISQRANAPFLLSLHQGDWALFRRYAPDFWSIHQGVYRFSGVGDHPDQELHLVETDWNRWAKKMIRRLVASEYAAGSEGSSEAIETSEMTPASIRASTPLIGRDAERRRLVGSLAEPGSHRVAVSGVSGVGKSTLVREVVADLARRFPEGIRVTTLPPSARGPQDLVPVLNHLLRDLGPGRVDAFEPRQLRLQFQLAVRDRRVLLVVEEVHSPELLEILDPAGACSILVTTRHAKPTGWTTLPLKLLGLTDSVSLLKRFAPDLPEATIVLIARRLGGHPLSLNLAGPFLSGGPELLENLLRRTQGSNALRRLRRLFRGVSAALDDGTRAAWRKLSAFEVSISLETASNVLELSSRASSETLDRLTRFGFLRRFTGERNWRIHPLLKALEREFHSSECHDAALGHAACHLEKMAHGRCSEEEAPEMASAIRTVLKPLPQVPALIRALLLPLSSMPRTFVDCWLRPEALTLWVHLLERSAREDGTSSQALTAAKRAGLACFSLEKWHQAQKYFLTAERLAERSGETAAKAWARGRRAATELLLDDPMQALATCEDNLGEAASSAARDTTLFSLLVQSLAAVNLGRWPAATVAAQRMESLLGGSRLEAPVLLQLGKLAETRGELAEALEKSGQAVSRAARSDEDRRWHPWALIQVAHLSLASGELAPAVHAAQEGVVESRRLGDRELEADAFAELGWLAESSKDPRQAEDAYRVALLLRTSVDGFRHPSLAAEAVRLGRILLFREQASEALEYFQQARDIFRTSLGNEHPKVADCLSLMAQAAKQLGELTRAEDLYRDAIAIDEKSLGANDQRKADHLIRLAGVLQAKKRLTDAKASLRQALAIYEHLGDDRSRDSIHEKISNLHVPRTE